MASQASGSGTTRRQPSGDGSASSSSGSPILEKKRPSFNDDMRSTSSNSNKNAIPQRRPSSSTRGRSSFKAVREDLDDAYDEEDSDETQFDEKDALVEQDKSATEESFGGLHYLPLIVAVVPPLGAILHGRAEAWTDFLILLLVAFYLYQVVRVPWELYYASRTRRINAATYALSHTDDDTPASVIQRRKAAQSELLQKEIFSLIFCVVSPFIGSYLLYYVKGALSDPDRYINPYNVRLFVLASGVKPWTHFFSLVKKRSLFLQSEVHYPTPTVSLLLRKVESMQEEINSLRGLHATKKDVKLLREGIDVPLTKLNKALKTYERKEEFIRLNNEEKFEILNDKISLLVNELNVSAELIESLKIEQERSGSVIKALRYIFSGERRGHGVDAQYLWYERGPFFYIFLPIVASNRILDATGRLFDSMSRRIGTLERSGMIENARQTPLKPSITPGQRSRTTINNQS